MVNFDRGKGLNNFAFPKYKKGEDVEVKSKGAVSRVLEVSYQRGSHWYLISLENIETYYAERELVATK